MKQTYRYLSVLIIAGFVIVGCIEMLNFSHPDTAAVNSNFNVAMDLKLVVDPDNGDFSAPLVVSILMPTAWNKSNVTVSYTSDNLSGGPYVNEPMRMTTSKDKYRSLNANSGPGDWNTEVTKAIGTKGNYEPVQWVTFIGTTTHDFKSNGEYTGTINVKLTTGKDNLKVKLAYIVCEDKDGLSDKYYTMVDKIFETTGGDNPTIDYLTPKLCSVNPGSYTWEDIVSFSYDATIKINDLDQPLKGKNAVHMIATATYNNGGVDATVTVDEISAKTLMRTAVANKWFLYMYPHEYFNIPSDKTIKKVSFYLTDSDRTAVMRPGDDTSLFEFIEKCH